MTTYYEMVKLGSKKRKNIHNEGKKNLVRKVSLGIVLFFCFKDDSDKFVQRDDFCETMITPGTSEAFRRPFEDRNPVGFGLHEFIRINSLYSGGFLSNSDILVVKANVSADNERCNWCSSSANDQLNQIDV